MPLYSLALLAVVAAAPHAVTEQLSSLKPIDQFAALPAPVRAGKFTVDGVSALGWRMAEPGGAFSATDVPVPGAPGRRLIFAACDADLCVIHYERGGIAHFYEILALSRNESGWVSIWNVRGPKPIANFDILRTLVTHGSLPTNWSSQSVKGDF
jgi:hypothetical protein